MKNPDFAATTVSLNKIKGSHFSIRNTLHTELGLQGALDYKDAAPTALPEGPGGFEPLPLGQASGFAGGR